MADKGKRPSIFVREPRDVEQPSRRQAGPVRETVRVVDGRSITRVQGTRGKYYVQDGENKQRLFDTIKSAEEWIKSDAQRKQAPYNISITSLREKGFSSVGEMEYYKNELYFTKSASTRQKDSISIEQAGFNKNVAVVRGRQEAAQFVQELRQQYDFMTSQYTNGSWLVYMNRDASGRVKRRKK